MHFQNLISLRQAINQYESCKSDEIEFYMPTCFYILFFPSFSLCLDLNCSLHSKVDSLPIKSPIKSKHMSSYVYTLLPITQLFRKQILTVMRPYIIFSISFCSFNRYWLFWWISSAVSKPWSFKSSSILL